MDEGSYPVAERLDGVGKDEVLLVDVGSGMGHDLQAFREKRSEGVVARRLLLQDQEGRLY